MTTKAFATTAVRIVGLVALFRGAMACANVAVFVSSALLATTRPSGRVLAVQGLGVVLGVVLPVMGGIICFAYSKPLAAALAKGAEDDRP
jgi:hypothetical protein